MAMSQQHCIKFSLKGDPLATFSRHNIFVGYGNSVQSRDGSRGGWGNASPPPPDLRLGKGMPKIHAKFVQNESKMLKITHHLLPPGITGSIPGPVQFL